MNLYQIKNITFIIFSLPTWTGTGRVCQHGSQNEPLHIPEADILKTAECETDHVMKSVYPHSMASKDEFLNLIFRIKLHMQKLRIVQILSAHLTTVLRHIHMGIIVG